MIAIYISVNNSIALSSKTGVLTTGMTGVTVYFEFDKAWKDLIKHIEFKIGDNSFSDLLPENNQYTVPPEMLIREDEFLYIGVRGENASNEIIIPTVYALVGNIEKGSDPGFPESQPWFKKIVDAIKGIVASITDTTKRIFAMEGELDQVQGDLDQIRGDLDQFQIELDNMETADEIYIGEDEPIDPNVCVWITPDDEMSEGDSETGGSVVDPETIKQAVDEYMAKNPVIETDPTVPAWAKQPTKPTYTAGEVGAMPADADIPVLPAFQGTAFVGQTIVVKAVDENGKPTELEAADFPSGGAEDDSFPENPQFDITVEEDCVSILLETLNDVALSEYGFKSMYIAVNSIAVSTAVSGDLTARVNHKTNGTVHPTATVSNFLRQTSSKWWHALFDFKNENVYWCATAMARAIDAVTSFKRPACYRKGASATMPINNIYVGGTSACLIPAGTKIYIWLR